MKDKNYKVYVHRVMTEDGPMYYAGVTKNTELRWNQSGYKGTGLELHISKYGWDNIEHIVVFESNNRNKAYEIEDLMILFYHSIGKCLNKRRSGRIKATDKKAYDRMFIKELRTSSEYKEHEQQYQRDRYANDQEHAERLRKYQRDKYANDENYKRYCIEYNRNRLKTPEGKIYNRVKAYNTRHPDSVIETPLEAKRKYLEYGYIPEYIKNDDL